MSIRSVHTMLLEAECLERLGCFKAICNILILKIYIDKFTIAVKITET